MLQSLTSAVVVQDTASMHALGVRLAAMFVPGDVIALEGLMGAGKTTLVQGIAWGLGLPQDQYAQSPSYAVAISYPTTPVLHHLDLYRFLENPSQDGFSIIHMNPQSITYESMGTQWMISVWDLPSHSFETLATEIQRKSHEFDMTYSRFIPSSLVW